MVGIWTTPNAKSANIYRPFMVGLSCGLQICLALAWGNFIRVAIVLVGRRAHIQKMDGLATACSWARGSGWLLTFSYALMHLSNAALLCGARDPNLPTLTFAMAIASYAIFFLAGTFGLTAAAWTLLNCFRTGFNFPDDGDGGDFGVGGGGGKAAYRPSARYRDDAAPAPLPAAGPAAASPRDQERSFQPRPSPRPALPPPPRAGDDSDEDLEDRKPTVNPPPPLPTRPPEPQSFAAKAAAHWRVLYNCSMFDKRGCVAAAKIN